MKKFLLWALIGIPALVSLAIAFPALGSVFLFLACAVVANWVFGGMFDRPKQER